MPDAAPVLELEHLVGGYGDSMVIRDVSIRVPAGQVVALLGPNGAGKTTLLGLASGLLRPRSGRVLLGGTDVTHLAPHQRAGLGLCHIPEGRAMFPSLTVRENIALQAPPGAADEAIDAALEAFPVLGNRLNARAATLSGGQQQMVALVPAFTSSPKIVMVDEASLGLAPVLVDAIFELLARVASSGVAMLLVEQYVTRALALASTGYVLDRGSVAVSGTAEELGASSLATAYLGGH